METKISREEAAKISEEYKLVLDTETHHSHILIKDEKGTIRWRENGTVRSLITKGDIDLNKLIIMFHEMGYDKNSEVYRKLYRDMGYSLYGYWQIFYWDMNNEDADKYKPAKP